MFYFLLDTFALICALLPLFAALWIVLPAPVYRLWLVSVAASEWSFWLALMTLSGVGILVLRNRLPVSVAVAACALAVGLALVPYVQSRRVAETYGIKLSLHRYLQGFIGNSVAANSQTVSKQTVTYLIVNNQSLQLDIYQADINKTATRRPAIIIIHGGYWAGGERSDFPQWNEWLAREGFVVFDIDYRLAPQPNWHESIGDVKCAIAWVKNHAREFNVDANRIALFGRSAGGHLALLAAYSPHEAKLAPTCVDEAQNVETSVRAVIALYAPTDLIWGYKNPYSRIVDNQLKLRNFLGGDADRERETFALMSPISYVDSSNNYSSHDVSTLLFHGGRDQLVNPEHMSRLAQRLIAARASHREILIPYGQHGFDYNFYGWGSQIAQSVMLDFLRTHLGAQ